MLMRVSRGKVKSDIQLLFFVGRMRPNETIDNETKTEVQELSNRKYNNEFSLVTKPNLVFYITACT